VALSPSTYHYTSLVRSPITTLKITVLSSPRPSCDIRAGNSETAKIPVDSVLLGFHLPEHQRVMFAASGTGGMDYRSNEFKEAGL